jgi:hypothetical protein
MVQNKREHEIIRHTIWLGTCHIQRPLRLQPRSLDDFAQFKPTLSASDAALIHGLGRVAQLDLFSLQRARELSRAPLGARATINGLLSVSNTTLFTTLEIHPESGDLTVVYNPWQSGDSEITLSVTDPAGNVTETAITTTRSSPPAHRSP